MKLYAQHGHAPSDKMLRATEEGVIDGVILSPRYLIPQKVTETVQELKEKNPDIEIIIDPEFYATRYTGTPNAKLRYLEKWPYFVPRKRNELLVGTNAIDSVLKDAFEAQISHNCTTLIAPNVYISNSFDSIEAAIGIGFINRARIVADDMDINVPIYATIAVGRDAIVKREDFLSFLNAITAIDSPPDGIYALVGAGPTDERVGTIRSEILASDVIGGWMLLNYSLSINGINTINGCADVLSPLLGIAGGAAGATGWWSNLQVFSMERYLRVGSGGQPPLKRYLSKPLLNRITINEREAFVEVVPEIMNDLKTDTLYESREPSRTDEALQTWEAISSLNDHLISGDIERDLAQFKRHTEDAEELYNKLRSHGFSERYEANIEYITTLRESIDVFIQLAEFSVDV
jgi:hypothetical protein